MLNFNNTLTSKIISLMIAMSFFMADISYAGEYQQGSLRVPMGKSTYERLGEGMEREGEIAVVSEQPKSIKSARFAFELFRAFLQRARGRSAIPYADLEGRQIFDGKGRRYTLHVRTSRGKFYILADADGEVKIEVQIQVSNATVFQKPHAVLKILKFSVDGHLTYLVPV